MRFSGIGGVGGGLGGDTGFGFSAMTVNPISLADFGAAVAFAAKLAVATVAKPLRVSLSQKSSDLAALWPEKALASPTSFGGQ